VSAVQTVECVPGVRVTVTGPITHLCPHVDEVDEGEVTIGWRTSGKTFELHSLAAHLRTYATQRISHEDLVAALRGDLKGLGCFDIDVSVRFTTASLTVGATHA
jgi:NADPH-dependent 7-cyano-7-deazaguanine reductase QueF